VLTPDFGTVQNAVNMGSNRKVFYMRKFILPSETTLMFRPSPFGIISRAKITLGLSCRCSECFLVDYAPRTTSDEGMLYMDCLRLVESVDFDIKIVQIRGRMQPVEAKQVHAVFSFGKSE
jgi:hypothetical protein